MQLKYLQLVFTFYVKPFTSYGINQDKYMGKYLKFNKAKCIHRMQENFQFSWKQVFKKLVLLILYTTTQSQNTYDSFGKGTSVRSKLNWYLVTNNYFIDFTKYFPNLSILPFSTMFFVHTNVVCEFYMKSLLPQIV